MKLSNEEFKILADFLRFTYRKFCLSRIAHDEIGKDPHGNIFTDFQDIWTYILISLRHYYLINFAKVFDNEFFFAKGGKKMNLSIFRLSRDYFNQDDLEIVENIKNIRDELLAHLDAKAMIQGKRREKDYGLDVEKIEFLFQKTFKLLNIEKENYGYIKELILTQEKQYIQEKFNEWYNNFLVA